MRIKSTGALQLLNYGSNTFTGTATKSLQVDASGNVIEGALGGSAAWGGITGTLSAQTDLQNALNAKQDALGFTPYNSTNPAGYISSVPAQSFASLTGKPTTLSGYGITDNVLLTNGSAALLTSFPTLNQNTTGTAGGLSANIAESQVTNLTTDLSARQTGGSAYLTSNFTTTNTTATSTNLTFSIAANDKYVVVNGTCSKGVSATGLKFAIAAPAGATISGVQYGGAALLATPLVPSLISAINTLGTTLATGIGITVGFQLYFTVINSGTAGSVTLQAATVTSNTATIFSGTSMTWTKTSPL
jgi:hypothetical protein